MENEQDTKVMEAPAARSRADSGGEVAAAGLHRVCGEGLWQLGVT